MNKFTFSFVVASLKEAESQFVVGTTAQVGKKRNSACRLCNEKVRLLRGLIFQTKDGGKRLRHFFGNKAPEPLPSLLVDPFQYFFLIVWFDI